MKGQRRSGILLHVTSLPSRFGVGDLGPEAYRFVDFLAAAGQGVWQILPLNPTTAGGLFSPYSCPSAFAGNPLLVSLERLVGDGLLRKRDLAQAPAFRSVRAEYPRAVRFRQPLLERAVERFLHDGHDPQYERFCQDQAYWLDDYAAFAAIRRDQGGRWWMEWPEPLRKREPAAMERVRTELAEPIERQRVLQYLFFRQWNALRAYAHEKGVQVFGDVAIYVAYDSADVWSHPELFLLDEQRRPTFVSGVPPLPGEPKGQYWGTPVYDWHVLRADGYDWWVHRMRQSLALYDLVRIDHFLGIVRGWYIPYGAASAKEGHYVDGPKAELFDAMARRIGSLPIVAEDIGHVTAEARELMSELGLPGMRVILWAFDGDVGRNPYAPHNHPRESIVYTGTHDNNTVRGWFERDARARHKRLLFDYLGREVLAEQAPWEFIRMAQLSPAETAILPMQDVLGLGREARMNRPGTRSGNWLWRMTSEQLERAPADRLRRMCTAYGRTSAV